MMKKLSTLLTAFVLSGTALAADDEINLAGHWSFQAEVQEGCEFSGSAQLKGTAKPGYYLCEMVVRDYCQGNEAIVRQSCVVTREDNRIKVNAVIEEYFQEPDANYKPDNFRLTLDPASEEMNGELDSYGIWKAKWKRSGGGLS